MAVLSVATCQFAVSADVAANYAQIVRQMRAAKRQGATVAHFPEGALSGYAGVDFPSFAGFDWAALTAAMGRILAEASQLGLWVILGSAHRLGGGHRPHNSLYVIDSGGQVVNRYDKRFCSGDAAGASGDLAHYTPGNHFAVWSIDGVRCGALICYDYRFPELYREYARSGVQLVFHSFHAGHLSPELIAAIGQRIGPELASLNRGATHTYPAITMPATMTATAAANHVWISCPNSSARESCWPAFFVRADGATTGRLRRNVAGVLVSTVDTDQALYDSTTDWRARSLAGTYHSGRLVRDARSTDRTCW
jgi:predicted amidohydrolase